MIGIEDKEPFLNLFRPPKSMKMRYAVGTTFSLDLETLIQLAFNTWDGAELGDWFKPNQEGNSSVNLPRVMGAIQGFSTHSVVFLQNARIKVPKAFDEFREGARKRLVELSATSLVGRPEPEHHGSFHPKCWFLKYEDSEKIRRPVWRLIVASKNLTSGKQWDIQSTLHGFERAKHGVKVEGLKSFLQYLAAKKPGVTMTKAQFKILGQAIEEAGKVYFELPRGIQKAELLWGPRDVSKFRVPLDRHERSIVISPFLKKKQVSRLKTDDVLITSEKDLHEIPKGKFLKNGKKLFVFDAGGYDLHAKVYLCKLKNSRGSEIYLGSANFTNPAMGEDARNEEVMLKMTSNKDECLSFEKKFMFEGGDKTKIQNWLSEPNLEKFETGEKTSEIEEALESIQRAISRGEFQCKRQGPSWGLVWSGEMFSLPKGLKLTAKLLGDAENLDLQSMLKGKRIALTSMRPGVFLIVRLHMGSNALEFSNLVNVVGRGRSVYDECVEELLKESDMASVLSEVLGVKINSIYNQAPREMKVGHKSNRVTQVRLEDYLEAMLLADYSDGERVLAVQKVIEEAVREGREGSRGLEKLWAEIKKSLNIKTPMAQ
ncbi:MAG: hypothetical protein J0L75_03705 [Spirochaetes bacterium]|nr:hypothetical protein [Spirochaetota bacterium]